MGSRTEGYLIFVGGVEGDLDKFGVVCTHLHDIAHTQLGALEQGSLAGVSGALPLQHRHFFLVDLELGSVAQSSDFGQ